MGFDVALGARVAVMPPGAAHPCSLFQHHEIFDAGFQQLDGGTHAARAGANDDDAVIVLLRAGHREIVSFEGACGWLDGSKHGGSL